MGCAALTVLDPPFTVVTSEEQYFRLFCVHSKVDWQKFRLAVYTEHGTGGGLYLDTVAHDGSAWVVVLTRTRTCSRDIPGSYEMDYEAVLVPTGEEPVRLAPISTIRDCAR